MTKLDFRKRDPHLYTGRPGVIVPVEVPPMTFLAVDGQGAPESAAYAAALAALYPMAYGIKFALKARGADFVVGPLEALWWADDPSAFVRRARAEWCWTVLLRLPDTVTATDFETARTLVRKRRTKTLSTDPDALDRARLCTLAEGAALQAMHHGPYADEGPLLHRLHSEEMPARGLTWNGHHHEIYLSDPRRVAPDRLRTILRQPVRPA